MKYTWNGFSVLHTFTQIYLLYVFHSFTIPHSQNTTICHIVCVCAPVNMPYDERYLSTPYACVRMLLSFLFRFFLSLHSILHTRTRPNTHTHTFLIYAIEIGYSAWQSSDSISSIETQINKFLFLFLSLSNYCSFISVFCAFWTGLSGCWRRSAGAITATAILMLLTCLLAAGAMGLWHTVEFFEKEKVVGEEFYQQWTNILRDNTRISYDWSYILAWAGVASSLIAAILLSGAAVCLRSEREKEEQLNLQYLMPGKWHSSPLYLVYVMPCYAMSWHVLIVWITLDFRLITTVEWKLCRHILIDSFDPLKINTIRIHHLACMCVRIQFDCHKHTSDHSFSCKWNDASFLDQITQHDNANSTTIIKVSS